MAGCGLIPGGLAGRYEGVAEQAVTVDETVFGASDVRQSWEETLTNDGSLEIMTATQSGSLIDGLPCRMIPLAPTNDGQLALGDAFSCKTEFETETEQGDTIERRRVVNEITVDSVDVAETDEPGTIELTARIFKTITTFVDDEKVVEDESQHDIAFSGSRVSFE